MSLKLVQRNDVQCLLKMRLFTLYTRSADVLHLLKLLSLHLLYVLDLKVHSENDSFNTIKNTL